MPGPSKITNKDDPRPDIIPSPAPSTSSTSPSLRSQDGSTSVPPLNGAAAANATNGDLKRLPVPKKPSMTSRISGIFGRKDASESSKDVSRDKLGDHIPENSVEESDHSRAPSVRAGQVSCKPSDRGIREDRGRGSMEKKPEEPKRFWLNPDGTHEHYLKVNKRQQKLKDVLRNLFDKKGPHDEPLSLVADWVHQKKNEDKASTDVKGGPNSTMTLVQKYGKCQEVIGHGAFGIVRVAHKMDANDPKREQLFAVKEFRQRPGESDKKYQKRLTSEFCLSSSMQHPNIIHTLDLLKDDKGDYCEVMEYCAGGDLYTLILAAGHLEVLEADCYFKQIMRGVEYMHEMGVAHRDLKPENLLLTEHGAIKITDFGNGECFRMAWEKEAHMTAGLCGSAPYIAPEEYIDAEFDPRAVDVWACGIIYMAMRTGRHLWRLAQKGEDEFFTRYLEDRKEESGFRPIEILKRVGPVCIPL